MFLSRKDVTHKQVIFAIPLNFLCIEGRTLHKGFAKLTPKFCRQRKTWRIRLRSNQAVVQQTTQRKALYSL